MTVFHLPDLGEGLQEAEIVAWHVSPGDRVVADQPLVSVETDKAVVEIPAPRSGRIKTLFGAEGDVVNVGAELAEFDDDAKADVGAVVGTLPEAAASEKRSEPMRETPVAAAAGSVKATPAVRALAGSLGVEISELRGTGPAGSITLGDVQAAAKGRTGTGQPLRGARRTMAQTMTRAGAEVVPATIQDVANVNHWPDNTDPTIRLIRAIAAGIAAEPGLNAWFDGAQGELTIHDTLDLGLATDTPDGLFVPVVRDADTLDDARLRERLETLMRSVADRSIAREDLLGQTFTLSNFGMIAGRHVTLVVVPPQVAILGTGRINAQAVAVDGKAAVRRMLPLSLTFDHRVITGGEAARFLAAVITDLEAA